MTITYAIREPLTLMPEPTQRRRLAAILVADIVGYSRLLEADEAGTLAQIKSRRSAVVEPALRRHGGTLLNVSGDGFLIEFSSAVSAVDAAFELQAGFGAANAGLADDRHVVLRIGINLGEVVGEGADTSGNGLNVAARLEQLAKPGTICVSAKIRDEVRSRAGVSLTDLGEHRLKNIAEPVRVYRVDRSEANPASPASTLAGAMRPSIAILPFANMSGDPTQQYLADGITEDLTTELSRFRGVEVASRLASFHFAGQGLAPETIARQLGVGFFVEGSVRKMGARIRVTAQLIDSKSGTHVWAERYDRDAQDIFSVQDEVVAAIVANLDGRMISAGAALARKKPTASWSAYDYLLQGRELTNDYREPDAVPLFRRAVEIDPTFALAHAWLAIALTITRVELFTHEDVEADETSLRALALDEGDSTAHWARALVLHWRADYKRAGAHFERAMRLNPSDVAIRGDYANWQRMGGQLDEALDTIDRAIALGPFVPRWFLAVRGHALFDLRRYGEAIKYLEGAPDHYVSAGLYLAGARAMIGDLSGAKSASERALRSCPRLTIRLAAEAYPYADPGAHEHFIDALRRAGLPA